MAHPARVRKVVLAVVCVLTMAQYAPLRDAPFVYEDSHALRAIASPLMWAVPGRTLTTASYLWSAGSPVDPGAFHLGNLAIHLANGLLVYAIGVIVVGGWPAILAASTFLVHPLSSEAVAYVSGRSDLLVTLCLLLAVWATLLRGSAWWRGPLVVLALAGAATSKELGIVGIPLVVVTLWLWRPSSLTAAMAPLLLVLGVAIGSAWASVATWVTLENGAGGSSLAWTELVVRQLAALTRLLALVVWPVGFSVDHDMLALGEGWRVAGVAVAMLAAVVVVTAWRRCPAVAFSVGWVALSVGPRMVVHTSEWINEHQMYVAMAGLSWLIGLGLDALWHGRRVTWPRSHRITTSPTPPSATALTDRP